MSNSSLCPLEQRKLHGPDFEGFPDIMKVLITLFAVLAACYAVSYEGYTVLRVVPGTAEGVERFLALLESPEVSLWKEHGGTPKAFDVMVSPSYYQTFIRELERHIHTAAYTMIKDVQEQINENMQQNMFNKRNPRSVGESRIDHSFYRTLDEIYAELENFAATYDFMSLVTVGTTLEGRPMQLIEVSTDNTDTKPVIWIDCGIHAREWITPASCLYYLDSLSAYGTDPEATALLDKYDFYILTVVNPDGYAYTWSDDRMWRKNRVDWGTCVGTDLNRNFETGFGGPGASDSPCMETYHGPTAFSELETQALRDQILALNGRGVQYYNMHSYSQLWMYPNGYTTDLPANAAEQDRVAAAGVAALEAVYGTNFVFGPIATTIYLASGGSVDWVYDPAGIQYSYTLEMRDTGLYGFLLPPDQILPVAIESWAGVVAAVNAV